MLCFVLPTPAEPPYGNIPPRPTPRDSGTVAVVVVLLIAFGALIAPFGWTARIHRPTPAAGPLPAGPRLRVVRLEAAVRGLHDPSALFASLAAGTAPQIPWALRR